MIACVLSVKQKLTRYEFSTRSKNPPRWQMQSVTSFECPEEYSCRFTGMVCRRSIFRWNRIIEFASRQKVQDFVFSRISIFIKQMQR
jgi:hypothetical protein